MSWLCLVISLPTARAAGRMRVWRALKALGCGVLRDGVYVLPANAEAQAAFAAQVAEIHAVGGQAHMLSVQAQDAAQEQLFRGLFDRAAEYAELQAALEAVRGKLKRGAPAALARELTQLQKSFQAVAAVDYFPDAAREQVAAALDELAQQIEARLNPDEPHAVPGKIKRLERAQYQGRTWATRKHLWVDRMASAWLIARFIDDKAKFKWLNKPEDCPKRALGFDFDGATFTHVGNRVSFEVLLASFGLDEDAALARIAGMVHYLDVGGVPVAEAAGVETVLKGLRDQAAHDDALLAAASAIFDGLYAAYSITN